MLQRKHWDVILGILMMVSLAVFGVSAFQKTTFAQSDPPPDLIYLPAPVMGQDVIVHFDSIVYAVWNGGMYGTLVLHMVDGSEIFIEDADLARPVHAWILAHSHILLEPERVYPRTPVPSTAPVVIDIPSTPPASVPVPHSVLTPTPPAPGDEEPSPAPLQQ